MILNRGEITSSKIVEGSKASSSRSTTYDATIGEIVCEGSVVESESYDIERRGIVWVVSEERFKFDGATTGLATLKTSWTHKGVLALNVGIIDPGWEGPLATALVNFSGSKVQIRKGDPFFRVMFLTHNKTTFSRIDKTKKEYLEDIKDKSRQFSDTFLHMDSITDEVSRSIFKLPKWGVIIGWIAIGIALCALFIPMGISVWTHAVSDRHEFHALENRIESLEDTVKQANVANENSMGSDIPTKRP